MVLNPSQDPAATSPPVRCGHDAIHSLAAWARASPSLPCILFGPSHAQSTPPVGSSPPPPCRRDLRRCLPSRAGRPRRPWLGSLGYHCARGRICVLSPAADEIHPPAATTRAGVGEVLLRRLEATRGRYSTSPLTGEQTTPRQFGVLHFTVRLGMPCCSVVLLCTSLTL